MKSNMRTYFEFSITKLVHKELLCHTSSSFVFDITVYNEDRFSTMCMIMAAALLALPKSGLNEVLAAYMVIAITTNK